MKSPTEPTQHPWHAYAVEAAFAACHSDTAGLAGDEASRRLERDGPNQLQVKDGLSWLQRAVAQFNNVLIQTLLVAGLLSFALGHPVDAALIFTVVILNAAIGLIQEGKAEQALSSIRKLNTTKARVLRDGMRHSVPAEELVVGDVVMLARGDRVPADLRLFQVSGLQIDDALLTGESMPVARSLESIDAQAVIGDRVNMAYSGTLVIAGSALGLVVATGQSTEVGKIGALIAGVHQLKTPLLQKMATFSRQLTGLIGLLAVLTLSIAIAVHHTGLADAFVAVVGLAVAAIPEGLPAILTMTLAIGVRRMATKQAIIRKLPAVETIGAVTVICSDKTGTLTTSEMMVEQLITCELVVDVTGRGYAPEGQFWIAEQSIDPRDHPQILELLKAGALNNDASIGETGGQFRIQGSALEAALLSVAHKAGIDTDRLRQQHPRLDEIPFDAAHKLMATRHPAAEGFRVLIKGAPEQVLARCASEQTALGPRPIDHAHWIQCIDTLAGQGQRILAIAHLDHGLEDAPLTLNMLNERCTLLGLLAVIDPPRPEAKQAIAETQAAGIRVVMITGDHGATAAHIARQLGISQTPVVLTGAALDTLSEQALSEQVVATDVFARTTPEHKLRIVSALQANGQVVAMTGDGVNDAPALKRADIGIAMGQQGTEAAKEAAEMILVDDHFATITQAIREGRTVFDNLQKVITWTLPTNGGEAMIIAIALLFGLTLPISAVHILWVNMVSAIALGLTLAFEPEDPRVMTRPPRRPDAPLLDGRLGWQIVFVSALFVGASFYLFESALTQGASLELARTVVVHGLIAMEVVYLLSVRMMDRPLWTMTGVQATAAVWAGILAVLLAQILFSWLPWFQWIFASTPVPLDLIIELVGVSLCVGVLIELEKWLWTRWKQRARL